MSITATVDRLVARLRKDGIDIRPIQNAPWVESIEQRLCLGFPPSFRSLIEHYSFPLLDLGEIELFGNEGGVSEYDLNVAPFRDPIMSPWLTQHKLIHIGHPFIGNYDPICLDLSVSNQREPTVVQLNHEDILLARRTVRRSVVADSFPVLMERACAV